MGQIIVGIGELLWDLLPGGKKLGGAPANFAYHARSLGNEGLVVSCLGDDTLGREMLGTLGRLSIAIDYLVVDKQFPTGTVAVRFGSDDVPSYEITENVAWDHIPFTPLLAGLAARADAVCFGSLAQRSEASRHTIRSFLDAARADAVKIFDVNLRQHFYTKEVLQASLHLATVLKVSEEELPTLMRLLAHEGEGEVAARQLAEEYNLEAVALTLGARGSVIVSGSEISRHKGFPVKVVDTVGAGDSFTAALAVGLLNGFSLDEVNEKANRLSSYVCGQAGGTPELPESIVRLFED